MRYKQYNTPDLKTSVVGIGTWPMSNIFWGKTEEKDCLATLNEALDCGINLIDTAPCYGDGRTEKLIAILIMLGSATTCSCFVMAKNMKHEGTITACAVMMTTLLSAFSLTMWLFVLKSLGYI